MDDPQITDWAAQLVHAHDRASPVSPLTDTHPELSPSEAYAIAAQILQTRTLRGESAVGWKVGFTNRTIWDEYGVHAPIWGPLYSSTVGSASEETWRVSHLHEPRIEPEIAFRFAEAPRPGSDEATLLAGIDAVCHGVEVVQSPFPGWRFRPEDTMAAGALHGNFAHGDWTTINPADRDSWLAALQDFSITLHCNGETIDQGRSENVLGGPLTALRYFVDGIAAQPHGRALSPGDIVTTGTVTRAFPMTPGEHWTTTVDGLPLAGLSLHCV